MLQLPLGTLLSLLPAALSAPHAVQYERRHSDCFSYNQQGCAYPVQGKQGAVATVSVPSTACLSPGSISDRRVFGRRHQTEGRGASTRTGLYLWMR